MKVSELITQLQAYDPEQTVHISYNYGDHWRTTVAPEVKWVEEENVKPSAYHNMPVVVSSDDADEGPVNKSVVVIS